MTRRVGWSVLLVTVCLLVELLSAAGASRLQSSSRIALEGVLHASLGIAAWAAFTAGRFVAGVKPRGLHQTVVCLVPAAVFGAGLDVDHVLAAAASGRWTLAAAAQLSDRPAGHNLWVGILIIPLFVNMGINLMVWCGHWRRSLLQPVWWCQCAAVVVASHQLRDALRRGLWVSPVVWAPSAQGSTPPLPLWVYILASVALAACGDAVLVTERPAGWAPLEVTSDSADAVGQEGEGSLAVIEVSTAEDAAPPSASSSASAGLVSRRPAASPAEV